MAGIVIGVVVVAAIFGLIALVGSGVANPETTSPITENTPPQGGNEVVAVATSTGPATSFGDGTFIVGTDIEPGTYRTSGGSNCYYARLSGFDGTFNDIIANSNTDGNDAIVTIESSDAGFQSSGCGTWTQVSVASSSVTTVKTEGVPATTPTEPSQPEAPSQQTTPTISGWSAYASTSLTDILNDPGYYLGDEVEVEGVVYDFLGAGGRGGTENYIEIAPLAGIDSATDRIMLQVDSSVNYLTATQALNTWVGMYSGSGNITDGVIAYGTVQESASFSLTSGGDTSYPVIEIVRLDKCTDYACDDGAVSLFPAGLITAASTQAQSDDTTQPEDPATESTPSNPRYFQFYVTGTCDDYDDNGAITLTGYPYAEGYVIPTDYVDTWTDGEIAFTVPTTVPAGTYQISFRGYEEGPPVGSAACAGGGKITVP